MPRFLISRAKMIVEQITIDCEGINTEGEALQFAQTLTAGWESESEEPFTYVIEEVTQ